jgi:hypothetical protein
MADATMTEGYLHCTEHLFLNQSQTREQTLFMRSKCAGANCLYLLIET